MSNPENEKPVYLNPDQSPMANLLDASLQMLLGNLRDVGIPIGQIRTICYSMAFLSIASPRAWAEFQDNARSRPGDSQQAIKTLTAISEEAYRPLFPGFPPSDQDPPSPEGEVEK